MLLQGQPFSSFSMSHLLAMMVCALFGYLVIKKGMNLKTEEEKTRLGLLVSLIPLAAVFYRAFACWQEGHFSIQENLPLHICRVSSLILPFVMLNKNRTAMGILFFWTMGGTLQANITPEIEYNFPHWDYFCYWGLHAILMVCALYLVFVYDLWVGWRDYMNAVLASFAFVVAIYLINILIGSNYGYVVSKPNASTLLDYFGPWPIYVGVVLLLMFVVYFLVLLPFLIMDRIKKM